MTLIICQLMQLLHCRKPADCSGTIVLGEATLAVLDHLLVLHVPWHCFQKDLFYDLPRHRGDAHWSAVFWVLLSTFFTNGSNVSIFPVTKTWLPGLLKYYGDILRSPASTFPKWKYIICMIFFRLRITSYAKTGTLYWMGLWTTAIT